MPAEGVVGEPEKPLCSLKLTLPEPFPCRLPQAAALPAGPGDPAGPAGPVGPAFPAGPWLPANFFACLAAILPTSFFSGPVSRPAAKAAPVQASTREAGDDQPGLAEWFAAPTRRPSQLSWTRFHA